MMEDDRDDRDEHEVDRDADLDRRCRLAARELEGRQRQAVLDEDDPEHLQHRRPSQAGGRDPERDQRENGTLGVARLEPDLRARATRA